MIASIIAGVAAVGGAYMSYQAGQTQAAYLEWAGKQAQSKAAIEADTIRRQAGIMEGNIILAQHEARMSEVLGTFNDLAAERDLLVLGEQVGQARVAVQRRLSQTLGAQSVGYAKSGVEFGGTPETVMRETSRLAAQDLTNLSEAATQQELNIRQERALAQMGFALQGARAAASGRQTAAQAIEMYRAGTVMERSIPWAGIPYSAGAQGARWGSYSSLLSGVSRGAMIFGSSSQQQGGGGGEG